MFYSVLSLHDGVHGWWRVMSDDKDGRNDAA